MKGKSRYSTRIGIFGGSFDPPHIGHFYCALIAAEKLGLDRLLVIPTAIQPHKLEGPSASNELRCRMIQALIRDDPLFEMSMIEIDRGGISYTVETLMSLSEQYPAPDHELYCLIGADAFDEIDTWKETKTIFKLARVVVLTRPENDRANGQNRWSDRAIKIVIPKLEISSTEIRQRIAEGLPIRLIVGDEIDRIIREQGLYRV